MNWRRLLLAVIALMLLAPLLLALLHRLEPDVMNAVQRELEIDEHRRMIEVQADATLREFSSDGCSGGQSTVWKDLAEQFKEFRLTFGAAPPWQRCCERHDRIYHAAAHAHGADESFEARLNADRELRRCVLESGKGPEFEAMADGMYLAVRLGGGPCTTLPWRWGYGWPECDITLLEQIEHRLSPAFKPQGKLDPYPDEAGGDVQPSQAQP